MTITISRNLAATIQRLLNAYSDSSTYTYRPRVGGVLQGCPRGKQATPAALAFQVKLVRMKWRDEVKPQWNAPPPPDVLVGARQDRVHKDVGKYRAGRSVKRRARPTSEKP